MTDPNNQYSDAYDATVHSDFHAGISPPRPFPAWLTGMLWGVKVGPWLVGVWTMIAATR